MRLIRDRSIAFKLFLLLFTSNFLVFLLVLGNNYRMSRRVVLEDVRVKADLLTRSISSRIRTVLSPVEAVVRNLTGTVERFSLEGDDLFKAVRGVVEDNPDIFGSAVAMEPGALPGAPDCFAPYAYRDSGRILTTFLDCGSYRYVERDWYRIPRLLERAVWSEPYFDEGGGDILMSTYSVPLYRDIQGRRRFAGIVTSDISLAWLQELVSSIRVERSGYAFLLSAKGTLLTHPISDLVMNKTMFGMARLEGDPRVVAVGQAMVRGEHGFVPWVSLSTQDEGWLGFAPVEVGGWSLGVFFPEKELMESVNRLTRNALLLGSGGFLALLGIVFLAAHSMTRPLRELAQSTVEIAEGNLDAVLPEVRSLDEIGRLTRAFEHMTQALKEHIRRLTEATRARERIESELSIARDIQMGILPKLFPPFPEEHQVDIYAVILPAREVGGDFYDFYRVDSDRICFVIGDVSGKGVPASLFMAVAKTLIKAAVAGGLGPGDALRRVNEELAEENEACMFVTVFLGIIDLRTGGIEYANGGHNRPFVLPKQGEIAVLPPSNGAVVGALEGLDYETGGAFLNEGDTLLLYTDGVTEALNEQLELFTEARLKRLLEDVRAKSLKDTAARIVSEVKAFAGAAEQADDITLLALTYYGDQGRNDGGSQDTARRIEQGRTTHDET